MNEIYFDVPMFEKYVHIDHGNIVTYRMMHC